jgi:hypothetical protein
MASTAQAPRTMQVVQDEFLIKEREVDYAVEEYLRAAGDSELSVLRQHLANGMRVDATGWNGYTALILAADCGNVEVVRELLAHRASLDITWCDKQDTAMWYATRNKDGKPSQVRPHPSSHHPLPTRRPLKITSGAGMRVGYPLGVCTCTHNPSHPPRER